MQLILRNYLPKAFFGLLLIMNINQVGYAQNNTIRQYELLTSYNALNEALVSGKPADAKLRASDFVKIVNTIDYKIISEGNIDILRKAAGRIAVSDNIGKQREYFENLSSNMVLVAKTIKMSTDAVFILYCPMKKASWLSSSSDIRNPYYGSEMLTCGEVKETIRL